MKTRTIIRIIILLWAIITEGIVCTATEAESGPHDASQQKRGTEQPNPSTDSTGSGIELQQDPLAFPPSDDSGCDVVVMLDSADNATPQDYTLVKEAVKMFISLLSEEDRVAVIPYGKHGIAASPLMVNIPQNRPALFNEMERETPQERVQADTPLEAGHKVLLKQKRRNRGIVFIISGKAASAYGAPETRDKILHGLVADRVRVFVTEAENPGQSPSAALTRETGGDLYPVRNALDLHVALSSIYEKLKTPDILPIQGDTFAIDADIREATVLISKMPGATAALVTPSGAQETASKHSRLNSWHASATHDLVQLRNPQPGAWRIGNSRSEGSRVYLKTDLRLEVLVDRASTRRGDIVRIDAWLEKKGVLVTDPARSGLGSVVASVVSPEGKAQVLTFAVSANPAFAACKSGVYSASFVAESEGVHIVKISVSGRNVVREREAAFSVIASPEATAPLHAAAHGVIRWGSVLIKFVLVNLAVAVLVGAVFLARTLKVKVAASRRKK